MKYISTRGSASPVSFREALFSGLAPDGGLYMPVSNGQPCSPLPSRTLAALRNRSFSDVATDVLALYCGDEISRQTLTVAVQDALNFDVPLIAIDGDRSILELFHGPTFAFKDVGARVMARLMAHFHDGAQPLTVLVATSGDTGSAVAHAFFGVEGTRVLVLFPEGQVTAVQQAQFTTLGGNVMALGVDGSFDDCQRLAKQAFADASLRAAARLTSANSINIGRLLPQATYYMHAALQCGARAGLTFSVPSGNFGNLTAGLMAKRLGAPIQRFIAATTVNDAVPRLLETGIYAPRPSIRTLANAMDVGDPSNAERIRWLFGDDVAAMRREITASVHTDGEVRDAIRELWERTGYVCDPHTAIAYLGTLGTPGPFVVLATAHPAKFRETVESIIGQEITLPAALQEALQKPSLVERIRPTLEHLRRFL